MIRIRFEPSGAEVEVNGGERLVDVLDELPGSRLPLACRGAHCGACRVSVDAGGELLEGASVAERETLRAIGAQADERLGCQLRLHQDARGELVLKVRG